MTDPIRHLEEACHLGAFFIDGGWRMPAGVQRAPVVSLATEEVVARYRSATGHKGNPSTLPSAHTTILRTDSGSSRRWLRMISFLGAIQNRSTNSYVIEIAC